MEVYNNACYLYGIYKHINYKPLYGSVSARTTFSGFTRFLLSRILSILFYFLSPLLLFIYLFILLLFVIFVRKNVVSRPKNSSVATADNIKHILYSFIFVYIYIYLYYTDKHILHFFFYRNIFLSLLTMYIYKYIYINYIIRFVVAYNLSVALDAVRNTIREEDIFSRPKQCAL